MQANAALKSRNIMLDKLEKSFATSRWISWRSCRNHTRGMCSANIELANVFVLSTNIESLGGAQHGYFEYRLLPRIERQSEVRPRPFEEECGTCNCAILSMNNAVVKNKETAATPIVCLKIQRLKVLFYIKNMLLHGRI